MKISDLKSYTVLPSRVSLETDIEEETPKEDNYFQRVGGKFKELGERVTSAIEQGATPTESVGGDIKQLGRTVLRGVGAVAEGAFTPIIEAPVIKQTLDLIGEKLADTKLGQKLAQKVQDNPESAQDIFDALNVLALGVGKTVEAPAKAIVGKGLTKSGTALEKGALEAIGAKKSDFIRKLVRPEQTKVVKESQVGRTIEKGKGVFKKSEILPTQQEINIEKAVSTIPEVKKTNTFQQNYNIIKEANTKEAQLLEKKITDKDFVIPKKEVKARLVKAQKSLSESPLITGDAEKTAEKLLAKANQLVDSNSGTGSGILKARKEYDAWVQSQKPKAFDAKAENAFTIANREVRDAFNQLLDEKAVDVGVKESLSKQSNLYRAMDNIQPKAATEADSAVGRAFQNMANAVGIKNKIVQQVAAVVGIGGLGAAATFAPAAAVIGGLGFLVFKGGKFILKPELRLAFSKLLKSAGKSLSKEDQAIIKGLLQDEPKAGVELPTPKSNKVK